MAQTYKWAMAVDLDRCTGCQACVVACSAENNTALNLESFFHEKRSMAWIRVERYWEGEYPHVKARFIPILCQHCGNAPCEPVCPVYATFHNPEGLNVQVYNRCVGTRYCANNCPYHARVFNFHRPVWPDSFKNYLNPDVTVRDRGIMEKCTFCVQRINRARRAAKQTGSDLPVDMLQPACAQACPTDAIVFGNLGDPNSRVSKMYADKRSYSVIDEVGTAPNVRYLKKIDNEAAEKAEAHA